MVHASVRKPGFIPSRRFTWLSAHLTVKDSIHSATADRALLDLLEPFVENCRARSWVKRYFFVRYGVGGPHIRLRLQARLDAQRRLRAALNQLVDPQTSRSKGSVRFGNGAHDRHELIKDITWVPYEPEIERYGGIEGVDVAEQLFCDSSEACLALLRTLQTDDRADRLGKAALGMVALVSAFQPKRALAAAFLWEYASNYLKMMIRRRRDRSSLLRRFDLALTRQRRGLSLQLNQAWRELRRGATPVYSLRTFSKRVAGAARRLHALQTAGRLVQGSERFRSWNDAIRIVVPSYLHMANNRMGVSVMEESYLAYALAQTLSPARIHVAKTLDG